MGWFQKLIGGESPDTARRQTLDDTLRTAGWQPGRTCDLARVQNALETANFTINPAARAFLSEYYGLTMDVPVAGVEGITGFVHFDPEMALRFLEATDLPRLAALMPKDSCPIGTTGGHTVFVFMDGKGRSYLLDNEWSLFAELAPTPAETIRVLCDGQNGRVDSVILDEGRRTTEVIRSDNEQRYWQLDQFPHVAPFLPRVSLAPARRPPTWDAMVRAAEDALAKGGSPSTLLITCGGFTGTSTGQMYFVGHGENSLYVRTHAGFRVLPAPPGIPSEFRTGQIIPFQPPTGW